jgi:hypothetical protein
LPVFYGELLDIALWDVVSVGKVLIGYRDPVVSNWVACRVDLYVHPSYSVVYSTGEIALGNRN